MGCAVDEEFDWKQACIEREDHYEAWSDPGARMKNIFLPHAHFAVVDVVHLLEEGRICASGSRDHSLKIWDISRLAGGVSDHLSSLISIIPEAHLGWIWAMVQGRGCLYTGSWDNTVRSWDLGDGSCSSAQTFLLKSAVLCLDYKDGQVAAGMFSRSVALLDPRTGPQPVHSHNLHRSAVLCLAMAEPGLVLSGSEDASVLVYDTRAAAPLFRIKLPSFPMCLSHGQGQLWLGDKSGNLHLLDPAKSYSVVRTFEGVHQGKVTGLTHSLGSLISSSTDKTIRVMHPTDPPQLMTSFTLSDQVSGEGRICASGSRDHSLKIWDISRLAGGVSDHLSSLISIIPEAHLGWIWAMVQGRGCLYTGSWDNTVRSWDLGDGSCSSAQTFLLKSAVLCLDYKDGQVAAGMFSRSVALLDPRTGPQPVHSHNLHRSAVLCLAMAEPGLVLSGSEDASVLVYDTRAAAPLFRIKGQLWLGDKSGNLHLLDPAKSYSVVRTFEGVHQGKVTGLTHSLGSLISSSTDKTIRVMHPTDPPQLMTSFTLSDQVSGISSYGTTLVSANSDASIGIWVEKSDLTDLAD
ncbi:FBXW9 [Cordylochernes scorpioides]|uniref:FBXW9 n=1 Tax=Cordylochernes scorpioides TaxID=51811 RepID=A0ABY6KB49_9ARAC|nr:FBXW9 [Cordylochernes scorpioides]